MERNMIPSTQALDFLERYLQADDETKQKIEDLLNRFTEIDTEYKAGRISKEENDNLIKQLTDRVLGQRETVLI